MLKKTLGIAKGGKDKILKAASKEKKHEEEQWFLVEETNGKNAGIGRLAKLIAHTTRKASTGGRQTGACNEDTRYKQDRHKKASFWLKLQRF